MKFSSFVKFMKHSYMIWESKIYVDAIPDS